MLKLRKRLFVRSSAPVGAGDELHLRKLRNRGAAQPVTRADLQVKSLLDDPELRRVMGLDRASHDHIDRRRFLDGAAA